MTLKIARIADLPAPGMAALEIFLCDLSHSDGRRAAHNTIGKRILQQVLTQKVRFVAIAVGAVGRAIIPYTEAEFVALGADLVDVTARAPGPVVITPCGVDQDLNQQLIANARRRDLELSTSAGSA